MIFHRRVGLVILLMALSKMAFAFGLQGAGAIPPSTPPDYDSRTVVSSDQFTSDKKYTITCTITNESSESILIASYVPNLDATFEKAEFRGETRGSPSVSFHLPKGSYQLKISGYRVVRADSTNGMLSIDNYSTKNSIAVSNCTASPM